MNLMTLEIMVLILALGVLLGDLWTRPEHKRALGYMAAAGIALIFIFSIFQHNEHLIGEAPLMISGDQSSLHAFKRMFVLDELAFFFKHLFLLAAFVVLIMAVEFSDRIHAGISEFYSLILFALLGMMFAASSNDLIMIFVALELITVTFYILTSFQRSRLASLEAGIKYLILGALASAFLVFGIALVFGTANTTNLADIRNALRSTPALSGNALFLLGLLMILVGFGFKIAAFPFQIWAPDVYQGSPAPTTAFLATGSKAAGIVLLFRVLFGAVPHIVLQWNHLLIAIAAITILYGNLCAIPQRNLKRLLGYSSISNAGYLLLGFAAMNASGASAILYYLAGYIFTVLAAFMVICLVTRDTDSDDITVLSGLNQRSPLLALVMTLAMVSLAGIPPLAGFFGKFLLLKAVVEKGVVDPAYYWLVAATLAGVIISLYYYFGVVQAIYWSKAPRDLPPIPVSHTTKAALIVCVIGMLYLGLMPERPLEQTEDVAKTFIIPSTPKIQKEARHP